MNEIVPQITSMQLPPTLEGSLRLLEAVQRTYWVQRCFIERHIKTEFFRNGDGAWRDFCMETLGEEARIVDARIAAVNFCLRVSEISETFQQNWPTSLSHATALAKTGEPQAAAIVYERVIANINGSGTRITANMINAETERFKAEQSKDWYTLEEWTALTVEDQHRLIEQAYSNNKTFNETNDNVEWALWTWNPVTGCLHDCPYCYARDIAARFFPQNFVPSFLPSRLTAPTNTKNPKLENERDPVRRLGLQNVFVCSMADLFGKWVPAEWIHAVLRQVADNPQWNFLFLTKFPIRMAEFDFPPNSWIGTTVDKQWAVERAEKAFRKIRAGGYEGVAWLSCEPMMERLTFSSLDMFDWVVMGGSSKSTQTPAFAPSPEWWIHLWNQAKQHNIPVYMKTNLVQKDGIAVDFDGRWKEYPL